MQHESPDVITTAPPLAAIPAGADLEATWDGTDSDDAPAAAHRLGLSAELLALYKRNTRLEILLAAAEERADAAQREARLHAEAHAGAVEALKVERARVADLEAKLAAERERAAAQTCLYESALRGIGIIRDGRLHDGLGVFVDACAHAKASGTAPDLMVSFFVTTCPVAFDFAGLLARIARRSAEIRAAVPTAAVVVTRDDAGDHALKDAAQ